MTRIVTRALFYLNAIDENGGEASRMDFLIIARNNEPNLHRMMNKLITKWKWIEEIQDGPKRRYRKTPIGEIWHKSLKAHSDIEDVIEELSRNRLSTD